MGHERGERERDVTHEKVHMCFVFVDTWQRGTTSVKQGRTGGGSSSSSSQRSTRDAHPTKMDAHKKYGHTHGAWTQTQIMDAQRHQTRRSVIGVAVGLAEGACDEPLTMD